MNENSEPSSDPTPPPSTPTPPPVNPGPPPVKQVAVPQPAIEEPEELGEIQGIFGWVKALLKKPDAVAGNLLDKTGPNGTGVFLGVLLLCHLIYGVILGLFSGDAQLYLVPVKFLGGTILGALICYPSLLFLHALVVQM